MKNVTKVAIGAAVIGIAIFAYKVWKNYQEIHEKGLTNEELVKLGKAINENAEENFDQAADAFNKLSEDYKNALKSAKYIPYISDEEVEEAVQKKRATKTIQSPGDVKEEFEQMPDIFAAALDSTMYRYAVLQKYEIITLTLLADNTLVDDDHDRIRDIYDILPEYLENHLNSDDRQLEDVFYIIHKPHHSIYEVVTDERNWDEYCYSFHIPAGNVAFLDELDDYRKIVDDEEDEE